MNDEQPTYSWPFPGRIIIPRIPGAKWHGNCEFCTWNWFSPTFDDICFMLQKHLLDEHLIDIEYLRRSL